MFLTFLYTYCFNYQSRHICSIFVIKKRKRTRKCNGREAHARTRRQTNATDVTEVNPKQNFPTAALVFLYYLLLNNKFKKCTQNNTILYFLSASHSSPACHVGSAATGPASRSSSVWRVDPMQRCDRVVDTGQWTGGLAWPLGQTWRDTGILHTGGGRRPCPCRVGDDAVSRSPTTRSPILRGRGRRRRPAPAGLPSPIRRLHVVFIGRNFRFTKSRKFSHADLILPMI